MLATMMSHATATATAPCRRDHVASFSFSSSQRYHHHHQWKKNCVQFHHRRRRHRTCNATELLPDDSQTNARTSWSGRPRVFRSLRFFNVLFRFRHRGRGRSRSSSSSFSSLRAGRMLVLFRIIIQRKRFVCLCL